MKKIIRIVIFVAALIFIALLSLPYLFDLRNLQNQINSKANVVLNQDLVKVEEAERYFVIRDKMVFQSLPYPRLVVKNLEAKNIRFNTLSLSTKISRMELYLSPIKLLFGKFSIKKIKIIDSSHNVDEFKTEGKVNVDENELVNLGNVIINEVLKDRGFSYLKLTTYLENNDFYIDYVLQKATFSKTNALLKIDNDFVFNGTTELNNEMVNFDAKLKNNLKRKKAKGDINIYSPILKWTFNYDGTYEGVLSQETLTIEGESILDIKDVQLFAKWIFDENAWQHKKLISEENLKIGNRFAYNKGSFQIKDININALNVSGTGDFVYNKEPEKISEIKFKFPQIYLDKLMTKGFATQENFSISDIDIFSNPQKIAKKQYIKNNGILKVGFFKYFPFVRSDFEIKVEADKISYNEKLITNLQFNASTSKQGLLKVNLFNFDLPNNGKFLLNGEGDYSFKDKGFIGNLTLKGEDFRELLLMCDFKTDHISREFLRNYNLASNVKIIDNKIYLDNYSLNFDDVNSQGSVEIALKNGIRYVAAKSKIDQLDVGKYFISDFNEVFSNGTLKQRLLWLNTINMNTALDLEIGKLIYRNKVQNGYKFKMNYGQGFVRLYDLDIKSEMFETKGNINFDIRPQEPIIGINLFFNKLYTKFDNENTLVSESEKQKVVERKYKDLLDVFLAVPSTFGFTGPVKVGIREGKFFDTEVDNFILSSELKNGQINIEKLTSDLFGGKCKVTGDVTIKTNKGLNLVLESCTFKASEMQSFLMGKDNINGAFVSSGLVIANGQKREDFLKSLDGKFKLKGIDITVQKFGLSDLMLETFKLPKDSEALANFNAEKILYDENKRTIFKEINGLMQINKNDKTVFKFDLTGVAISGAMNGNIVDNKMEAVSNLVFLTGTKTKQIPLNVAIKFSGDLKNIVLRTNTSQVDDYVSNIKNISTNTDSSETNSTVN